MTEMIRRFLRQKFGSPLVVIALAALAMMSAFQVAVTGSEVSLESSGFLTLLLLGAASVSRDASNGALQMILSRPIRRVEYLYGRYAGILAAYAVCVAATAGLALVFGPLVRQLLPQAGSLSLVALARAGAGALLSAALFASVLVLFSTFLRGYGDILAYFLLTLMLGAPDVLAKPLHMPWLAKVGEAAHDNLLPRVDWSRLFQSGHVLAPEVGAYALAVAAYLALAAVIFCRREFTYGHD